MAYLPLVCFSSAHLHHKRSLISIIPNSNMK
uniref:Uncharacterized protein n=1 Tax=Arundo donax TaxID=35708 RepID=A0A0A9C3M1_ARUDO